MGGSARSLGTRFSPVTLISSPCLGWGPHARWGARQLAGLSEGPEGGTLITAAQGASICPSPCH